MTDRLRLDGVRVLIVDDAPFVRDVVTDILQQDGAVVTAVETAEKALEILQRERPTVLLSDLSMPGKGGYWLIGQVRALPPDREDTTPAAAHTASTGPEDQASVVRAASRREAGRCPGAGRRGRNLGSPSRRRCRGVDAMNGPRRPVCNERLVE